MSNIKNKIHPQRLDFQSNWLDLRFGDNVLFVLKNTYVNGEITENKYGKLQVHVGNQFWALSLLENFGCKFVLLPKLNS
jgi:hypothetical protein